ncbi:MAG TPA: hypothetical protein VNO55_10890, partial [Polyangia bacterium]|nr:hypothetical protein [Polyangia bacterium]
MPLSGFEGSDHRRRLTAAARIAGVVMLALALGTVVAAPRLLSGARAGWVVTRLLPETRGQILIGGAIWGWPDVWRLVRGRPASVAIDHVRIIDPEGTPVFAAERISARLEVHRSPWRMVIRDAVISRARWHLGRMGALPGTGFLAVFAPEHRAGLQAPPGRGFAVRADGVRLDDVDATLDFEDWGLTLRAVRGLG